MKTTLFMIYSETRHSLLRAALFLGLALLGSAAQAQSNFDSLGSNEGILKRARALSNSQQVSIVQKRAVDRDLRLEFGVSYGGVAGGNSYLNTQPMTGNLEFHITPRWSVGARYTSYNNQLSKEGQSQFDAARSAQIAGQPFQAPEVSQPQSSILGTVSFYPIYGKLNLFDWTVVQFDFYVLGGYGQMNLKSQLRSGNTSTWTAGGGLGFWWNRYFSSRVEVRHQSYTETVYTGSRDVGQMIGTVGIGFML